MLNVKIFSDFACPFCYIGANMIEKLKRDGLDFTYEWYTFEMRPEMPAEGDDLSTKATEEQLLKNDKLYDMLAMLAKPYNLTYSNKFMRFNTYRSHLAAEYAKTQGKYDDFAKEAFKAYFTDTKNLADREVLNEIAGKIGLDVDEMNDQVDSGRFDSMIEHSKDLAKKHDVEGAPTFIINDKHKMTGIRGYDQFKNALLAFSE